MNSLKPLLIVAVLAGIGYGVYVRINSGSDAPPPGVAEGWGSPPKVQIDVNEQGNGWGPGGGPAGPPIASPFGGARNASPPGAASHGTEAPPYGSPQQGGAAPPYAPPYGAPPAHNDSVAGGNPIPPDPSAADPDGRNPYKYLPAHDPNAAPSAGQVTSGGPPEIHAGVPDGYRQPAAGDGAQAATIGSANYPGVMDAVKRELEAGQMASALRMLSAARDNPQFAPAEQQQIHQLLDQVAGTVVYSTQHLLESPYEVQPGERLEDISQRYNVPWQLLAKINGIDDPQSLRAGERLKVVRGPFHALVNLDKRQLTLMLADGSYAGRFAIGIGRDHPPVEGTYTVSEKAVNPVYHGRDRAVGGDDPANPLGKRWIGLGSDLAIHGTDRPENIGRNDLPGSISLSPPDVEDVYDILGMGSKVTIRR